MRRTLRPRSIPGDADPGRLLALARTLLAVILLGMSASPSLAELRVVAATTTLGAIADAVGGDLVEVEVVARPDRDLHALEVRPSTMRKTSRADVYLEVGMSLDYWTDDVIRGSRNRDLRRVDCSRALDEALEVPEGKIDAAMGDVHPEGNPHYWLDPERLPDVAGIVARAFAEADPANAGTYASRADAFADRVAARVRGWEARLVGIAFVQYHATWPYLADRFGMEIVGTVEPLPGIPPSARHLAELAATIRKQGARVVIREPYHDDDAVAFLVRETGVDTAVLPSSCDAPTEASLLAHLDQVVSVLGRPPSSADDDPPTTGSGRPSSAGDGTGGTGS